MKRTSSELLVELFDDDMILYKRKVIYNQRQLFTLYFIIVSVTVAIIIIILTNELHFKRNALFFITIVIQIAFNSHFYFKQITKVCYFCKR